MCCPKLIENIVTFVVVVVGCNDRSVLVFPTTDVCVWERGMCVSEERRMKQISRLIDGQKG